MPNAAIHLAEVDRLALALATSIKESIAGLAGQIRSLNQRYRAITGEDLARVEMSGGGLTGKRRGRPPGVKNGATSAKPAAEAIPAVPAKKPAAKKKRIRRNAVQLTEQAEKILAFIKKGGSEGVKGSAIRAEFGQVLPSIKAFVKQYAGRALKTTGEKAAMIYRHE